MNFFLAMFNNTTNTKDLLSKFARIPQIPDRSVQEIIKNLLIYLKNDNTWLSVSCAYRITVDIITQYLTLPVCFLNIFFGYMICKYGIISMVTSFYIYCGFMALGFIALESFLNNKDGVILRSINRTTFYFNKLVEEKATDTGQMVTVIICDTIFLFIVCYVFYYFPYTCLLGHVLPPIFSENPEMLDIIRINWDTFLLNLTSVSLCVIIALKIIIRSCLN